MAGVATMRFAQVASKNENKRDLSNRPLAHPVDSQMSSISLRR